MSYHIPTRNILTPSLIVIAIVAAAIANVRQVQCEPVTRTFLAQNRTLLTAFDVPCPTSEYAQYTLKYYRKSLTDSDALEIMTKASQCELWPRLRNVTLDFESNALTSTVPFQQALRALDRVVALTLSLKDNQIINPGLQGFNKLFETMFDLRNVTLSLYKNPLTDVKFAASAFRNNAYIEYASLDLFINNVASLDGLGTLFDGARGIKYLSLYVGYSSRLANISALNRLFEPLVELEFLDLKIMTTVMTDVAPLAATLKNQAALRYLNLDLGGSKQLVNIDALATAFSTLTRLQALTVSFLGCVRLQNGTSLASAWQNLGELVTLDIIFGSDSCVPGTAMSNMSWMGMAFRSLTRLRALNMQMQCNPVNSVDFMATAFQTLQRLESLDIYLYNNKITDVSPIKHAFGNLPVLSRFNLQLGSGRIAAGAQELAYALVNDIGPRGAFCPFSLDVRLNPIVASDPVSYDILAGARDSLYSFYQTTACDNKKFTF